MKIDINVTGVKETVEMLESLERETDLMIEDTLLEVGNAIVSEARSTLQNNQNINTGDLIANTKVLNSSKDSLTVGNNLPYADIIEYGRGPISAAPGKTLHWIDKTSGEHVFSKTSKATEPKPFLVPAFVKYSDKLPQIIEDKYKKLIKK